MHHAGLKFSESRIIDWDIRECKNNENGRFILFHCKRVLFWYLVSLNNL